MTPEEEAALTPETIEERIAGSKWVVVFEEAMVCTVWTCKLGMLFIYQRIVYDSLPSLADSLSYRECTFHSQRRVDEKLADHIHTGKVSNKPNRSKSHSFGSVLASLVHSSAFS